jgi:hypothetical protein
MERIRGADGMFGIEYWWLIEASVDSIRGWVQI